jgi:hypothetical protein
VLEVTILQRMCGNSYKLNIATGLEQGYEHEERTVMRSVNETDK